MPPGLEVDIRAPRDSEWPACRMLLARTFEQGLKPEAFLAFSKGNPQVLGAAAYRVPRIGSGLRDSTLIQMRVVRTSRRQGVGRALFERVRQTAEVYGAATLLAYADVSSEPDADPFLHACGMRRVARMYVVEVDLEPMWEAMRKLRDRALRSGHMPSGARLVSVADAPADQTAALYQSALDNRGVHPALLELALTDTRVGLISSVLMVGERAVAMVVVQSTPENPVVHVQARAVVPEYRGTAANVLVMADALDKGRNVGIRRIRFDSMDDNQDTLKLARRFQADTLKMFDRFSLMLA